MLLGDYGSMYQFSLICICRSHACMVKHTFRRGVLERMNAIAEIELGMMLS